MIIGFFSDKILVEKGEGRVSRHELEIWQAIHFDGFGRDITLPLLSWGAAERLAGSMACGRHHFVCFCPFFMLLLIKYVVICIISKHDRQTSNF
jgi:hypothetical protein